MSEQYFLRIFVCYVGAFEMISLLHYIFLVQFFHIAQYALSTCHQ